MSEQVNLEYRIAKRSITKCKYKSIKHDITVNEHKIQELIYKQAVKMIENVMLTLWLLHQLTPPVWETRLFLFHDDYQPTDPPLCLQSQAYHPVRGWLEALLERKEINNITLTTLKKLHP